MVKNPESRFTIRAIDKTQRVLDGIQRNLSVVTRHAKILGVAGAIALTGFAASGLHAADSLNQQARIAGIATSEMQVLTNASAQYGVSQEKLSDILKDVNDKVGDFIQTGGGPLLDFFEQIAPQVGVTADMFRDLSSADALGLYVESLEKANVSQSDMTFYMEAIANDATALQPVFSKTSGAIDQARKDIENFGIGFNEIDSAKIQIAEQQMARISQITRGASMILATVLAPVIDDIVERFINSAESAGGLGTTIQSLVSVAGKGLSKIGDVIAGWEFVIKTVKLSFGVMIEGAIRGAYDLTRAFELRIGEVVFELNQMLIAVNRASKGRIDFDIIRFTGFEKATEELENLKNGAQTTVAELTQDLSDFVEKPLPTQEFDIWFANLNSEFEESAAKLAELRGGLGNFPGVGDLLGGGVQTTAFRELEKKLGFNKGVNLFTEDPLEQNQQKVDRLKDQMEIERETILEAERITQEQKLDLLNRSEERYLSQAQRFQEQRTQLIMSTSSQMFGDLTQISSSFAGEQSGIYKSMFAASKAFAIAESIVKIQQGIASAAAVPFPGNLVAMASVVSATAGIVSTIQSADLSFEGGGGFRVPGTGRSGGIDGRGGVPFIAHPGEDVQITDHTRGNPGGGTTVVQNNTFYGHWPEKDKREAAQNGAEMALSVWEEKAYRNKSMRQF